MIEQIVQEVSISIATLMILAFIVRYFVATLEKKDKRIEKLVDTQFEHNNQVLRANTKAITELNEYLHTKLNGKT